mgnify:FL=1
MRKEDHRVAQEKLGELLTPCAVVSKNLPSIFRIKKLKKEEFELAMSAWMENFCVEHSHAVDGIETIFGKEHSGDASEFLERYMRDLAHKAQAKAK